MTKFNRYSPLLQPFTLPCGVVIPNRIAKAAMTERLSDKNFYATDTLTNLYKKWANSGTGLLISGNIMVDKRYKESSGNVVVENESGLEQLTKYAKAGTSNGNQFWAQISHGGRQSTIFSTFNPIAPSAVKLKKLGLFAKPKAMTIEQIEDVIERYVTTAKVCKKAGFTGVQFHAAHGYLLSQFLSPNTNKRTDEYGGFIENRSRVLLEIIKKARIELGADFPIAVKLNSADFQRGGFDEKDAFYVIERLKELNIDLLEISGGTYENIVFLTKRSERESTRKREAYFMEFAEKVRKETNIPLMVTGGFRTLEFCEQVIANNELEMIGFARPYLADESFPSCFVNKEKTTMQDASFDFPIKKMSDFAEAGFYDYQIHQIAKNKPLKPNYSPYAAIVRMTKNELVNGWF
ncbi:NADH:flavin oxidoreductase/NADH oxidase family protein [Urechidicola vernalis]|uniref:NADH:flavin oxidoreductase/NADH oxidase family protein n=1 Tax=Urechidicola vernalis TaxID=3075600 RepID=A0ABU2Y7G1_9FLAO|nr:NADH:flavin oxidoreductase/NADH oxidase family protein [Urechidicola sp. P050]MDT0553725.1 NADH:flavin oxidoreductase/NADH oxidase family protein [Urechidicola sp. P050]